MTGSLITWALRLRLRRRPRMGPLLCGVLLLSIVPAVQVATAPAAGALPLTVTVTIDQVGECCGGDIDEFDGADFYGRVFINGVATNFGVFDEDEDVITPNWVATGVVEHTDDYATVAIEVFDEDDFTNFVDNQIDLSVLNSCSGCNTRTLDLSVGLHTPDKDCSISGEAFGDCNQQIRSFGNEGTDVGDVFFRIAVSEPPQAPGLHVGCLHSPLWPQPGDTVTVTADSFGDQPDGAALPAKLADRIEIWVSTDGGANKNVLASAGRQSTFTANQVAGAAGSTLSYGCRVVDAGIPIYSGWHTVTVGAPPAGRAIPVYLSGDRERALDVVIFPVTTNVRRAPFNAADTALLGFPVYTGAADPNFQAAALAGVSEFMREQVVLDNQRRMNVWLATDGGATGGTRDLLFDADADGANDDVAPDTTGDGIPDGDGVVDTCQHVVPPNLARDYGFANVRAFLHPATPAPGNVNTLRECASRGVFSAEAGETGVFIHETGHAGWGLADEYCCDGGYFQTPQVPNVYGSLQACQNDVGSLGGVPGDCVGMDSVRDTDALPDFWVSDPQGTVGPPPTPPNDLMNDNQFARRADRRRISYVFGQCLIGKC